MSQKCFNLVITYRKSKKMFKMLGSLICSRLHSSSKVFVNTPVGFSVKWSFLICESTRCKSKIEATRINEDVLEELSILPFILLDIYEV